VYVALVNVWWEGNHAMVDHTLTMCKE